MNIAVILPWFQPFRNSPPVKYAHLAAETQSGFGRSFSLAGPIGRSAGLRREGLMFVLVVEFDCMRGADTRRETRYWTFSGQKEAESEAGRFARLARAGSAHATQNGETITFQESGLYHADTNDRRLAWRSVQTGNARLVHHAFNPALERPDYWVDVLDRLEQGERP